MFEDTPETPEIIHLFSSCLLSKWGFADGDQLDWIRDHNREYDPHATLIECIRRKMLPFLNQRVEIEEIVCNHNPCRASTVDGVDVTDLWYGSAKELDPPLSPECVAMSGAEILEVAESIRHNNQTEALP